MKRKITFLFLVVSHVANAQTKYWQQQCDYKIEVTLNDTLHTLDGFITIDYKNNSPQELNYILFHLWPNAYRDNSTPFAKHLLENGETDFRFSKQAGKGFIDHLDFKINAEVCDWDYDSSSLEIAKLNLSKPLKSGESIHITTPFRVKIPGAFSRMGHVGQAYQISQWYPKPAVFDKDGWHPMPYLDQGEFYSEYGSYDVSITLPQNYVVGATGNLQTETEIKWMDSLADATKKIAAFENNPLQKIPGSVTETKTIRYTQGYVHDFAWFADKRFRVLKGEAILPQSKNKIITWALFTDSRAKYWSKAGEYLRDAVLHYSKHVGEYPYQQVTAVDGALSAGGGMEYPNITVIGDVNSDFSLETIIAHEVGHNWFYGILGTNERTHAWMDEGINSYYEERYIRTKYPKSRALGSIPRGVAKFLGADHYPHKHIMDAGYQTMARENLDQSLEQSAEKFTSFNYGVMVYGKGMMVFDYLEAYLSTDVFDRVMKSYFEQWKFKHPQPEDLRFVFETETGKDLNWLFDDLIKTDKKIDYKVLSAKTKDQINTSVSLKNIGDVTSPVSISVLKRDSILRTVWSDGFTGKKNIEVNTEGADKIQIDPLRKMPELNRRNNTYFLNKPAHFFEKLRFQFLGSIENENRTQVFFAPYFGWNNYDKTQVGIALYSPFIPSRKFNYLLAPAVGTGSKQFIGIAKFSYSFYPETKVRELKVGVNAKRFSYILFPQPLLFNKLEPYVHVEFKQKEARSPYTHALHMRSVIIWLDWINFDKEKETQRYYVNELKYTVERKTTLNPFTASVKFQQGNTFANMSGEANFLISYKRQDEGFRIRVFAGGFILNTKGSSDISAPNAKFYLSNATTNTFAYWLQKDYMFDENFIDRNGRDKYLSRQVAKTDGAFRSFTTFGATNKFLMSVNLTTSTHRFFPVNPFVNAAFIVNDLGKPQFAAELGLSAIILRDMLEIHLPLVTTKNISENQKLNGIDKWYKKFSFTLKLQLQKPLDYIRRFF